MGRGKTPISTGVDKLLQLVQDEHKISLTKASSHLSVSQDIVSDWADMLDDQNKLIVTRTLRTTYLCCPSTFSKTRFSHKVKLHLHGLQASKTSTLDSILNKRKKDLEKKNKVIEIKLKKILRQEDDLHQKDLRLNKFESQLIAREKSASELENLNKKNQKVLEKRQKSLDKDVFKFEKIKTKFLAKMDKLTSDIE